ARAPASRADAAAAASPWLRTSVQPPPEAPRCSEVVCSLAAALLLLAIELARCLLGAPGLPGRAAAHHQPHEHDQQDCRADDVHHPPIGMTHRLSSFARNSPAGSPI